MRKTIGGVGVAYSGGSTVGGAVEGRLWGGGLLVLCKACSDGRRLMKVLWKA